MSGELAGGSRRHLVCERCVHAARLEAMTTRAGHLAAAHRVVPAPHAHGLVTVQGFLRTVSSMWRAAEAPR
jgi:hypothetical protein